MLFVPLWFKKADEMSGVSCMKVFWVVGLLLGLVCSGCATKRERPNVLFIVADDLGARLGCYGDPDARTPHLDKLAAQGVRFEHCFTQFPTCGPSRASMLSGLYPFQTGLTNNRKELAETKTPFTTLPRLFRENGYFTARFGKVLHMNIPRGIGASGADDETAWDLAINNAGWDGIEENFMGITFHESRKPGTAVCYADPQIKDEEMADAAGTQALLDIMAEHHPKKSGKPFLLFAGYFRPHPPMIAPRSHWEAIDGDAIRLPTFPADDRADIPEINFHLKGSSHNGIPEGIGRAYTHAYHASVHFIDQEVGRLVEGLKKHGLDRNTIIVFTGDQGFHLGEHGHWHKSTFFEQACQVPLIVVDPRASAKGEVAVGLCGLVDLYPTLCELAGIEPKHALSGQSLAAQLDHPERPIKKFELTQGNPGGISIRTERYRYTEWDGGAKGAMLYDLQADPNEFTNLAARSEQAKRVQALRAKIRGKLEVLK